EVSAEHLGLGRSVRARVQENAVTILRERGAPMRILDIHSEFARRRMPLPGRGTPTNIAAHLVASDRFSRRGRGIYGLAGWDCVSHSAEASPPASSVAAEPAGNRRAQSQA